MYFHLRTLCPFCSGDAQPGARWFITHLPLQLLPDGIGTAAGHREQRNLPCIRVTGMATSPGSNWPRVHCELPGSHRGWATCCEPALSPASPARAGGRSGFPHAEGVCGGCTCAAKLVWSWFGQSCSLLPLPEPLHARGLGRLILRRANILSPQATALEHPGEKIKYKNYRLKPKP